MLKTFFLHVPKLALLVPLLSGARVQLQNCQHFHELQGKGLAGNLLFRIKVFSFCFVFCKTKECMVIQDKVYKEKFRFDSHLFSHISSF